MRLTVVGSGDAFNGAGRGHACYLIEPRPGSAAKFGPTMIDFGATALLGLRRVGRKPSEIETFVFTHLHGDHIAGFPFLVIDGLFKAPRDTPLRVVGPVGTEDRLMGLLDLTYGRALVDKGHPMEFRFEEVPPGQRHPLAEGLTLETYGAAHMDPPDAPLCLTMVGDGRRVGFSGDTEPCPGLLAAIATADLAVVECTALAPPTGRHCTWQDWKEILPSLSGTRRVLLTHLGAEVRAAIPRLLEEAPSGSPPLSFAEDGLVIDLP